jgi:cytochrome oxidase Cu insertion factor (SCO1/SenC/PrrC family)
MVLLGLFAVFAIPILVAYGLNVWWPQWSPVGRMNHGELVEPAWEVELVSTDRSVAERVAGRWILLHPIEAVCGDACDARLDLTKRIHISLGKDYDRVVRMFVHGAGVPVEGVRPMDAELMLVPAPAAWFDRFAGDEPVLLLVDPQGQAVLQYGADLQAKGLARDLARVLKISKIG